jgi:hypothetical protein
MTSLNHGSHHIIVMTSLGHAMIYPVSEANGVVSVSHTSLTHVIMTFARSDMYR